MRERIVLTDWNLAQNIGQSIYVGKAFAFIGKDAFRAEGVSWLQNVFSEETLSPKIVSLLGREQVKLPGANINPFSLQTLNLRIVTSDKALYRQGHDEVHLFLFDPLSAQKEIKLSLHINGMEFSQHTVSLGRQGAQTLLLRDLPAGECEVYCLETSADMPLCQFTVATYRLAPLVASLQKRTLKGNKLYVTLQVETFGVALDGKVRLEMLDQHRRIDNVTAVAKEGMVEAGLSLTGEGPHLINVQSIEDPSRTASVPIVGSRASERAKTVFSPLGTEISGALLPGEHSRPVRGIFLEEGAVSTTPFRIERIDTKNAKLIANVDIQSALIVLTDPSFPAKNPTALSVQNAPHPQGDDPSYQLGEKLFKEGKFQQALLAFQKGRETYDIPHPYYAYYIACCYAQQKQKENAVLWLRQCIQDGWNEFSHLATDEDLKNLEGFAPYETLKTGGRKEIKVKLLAAGAEIEFEVVSVLSLVAIGAYIDGSPWEGWTTIVTPDEISFKITFPAVCSPSQDLLVPIEVESSTETTVYLLVKDARLRSQDTPESRLASKIKEVVQHTSETLFVGRPDKVLSSLVSPPMSPPAYLPSLIPMDGVPMPTTVQAPSPRRVPPEMQRGMNVSLPKRAPSPRRVPPEMQRGMNVSLQTSASPMAMESGNPSFSGASGGPPVLSDSSSSSFLTYDEQEEVSLDNFPAPGGPPADRPPKKSKNNAISFRPISARDPEVLFAGILPVKNGRAETIVKLGDAFADYLVEVFVFSEQNWSYCERPFRVAKDPFISLEVPEFLHSEDAALGRVILGNSGRLRVTLSKEGTPVPLLYQNIPLEDDHILEGKSELAFLVQPGYYQASVENLDTNEKVFVQKRVAIPGKLRFLAKTLQFLQEKESISQKEEPDILSMRILPGLKKPFNALIDATAEYGHACCEQTAAKLLAGCAMYTLAMDDSKRKQKAEAVILAGIRRERLMFLQNRGFSMYPDTGDRPDTYWGPKTARYLWNLDLLRSVPGKSKALLEAIEEGLMMAKDATLAYGLSWPPAKISSCEDAYMALRFSSDVSKQAISFVIERIQNRKSLSSTPSNRFGLVFDRTETAYAAATLLRAGNAKRALALQLTNEVVKQFGESGRLYSTVDSVAALALMAELQDAKIVGGTGRVALDEKTFSMEKALLFHKDIKKITSLEGVTAVEVIREKEEEWTRFASTVSLTVSLESGGTTKQRFFLGDAIELCVKLTEPYQAGDLLWVCLPDSLSRVFGGGQVKLFSLDFAGKNEIRVPLAATGVTVDQTAQEGKHHFAVCVRNMFEEERVGNPGLLTVSVMAQGKSPSFLASVLKSFQQQFQKK